MAGEMARDAVRCSIIRLLFSKERCVVAIDPNRTERTDADRELRDEFMNANSVAYLEEIEKDSKRMGIKGWINRGRTY